ncbi:hypothetical protein PRZ48_012157 [Zasmidium cellare]|uniref:Polyketide synthase n=1 Tax=Zasmidium cellare TaxID=395010 RepID=A0ABR0E448_ZASCE|nr:hypothetical protein PRZ48_012157 [Zasmidium cellare]
MEVTFFTNEFPKEELQDVFRKIQIRSKEQQHPLLAQFIAESTQAVKEEVAQLPSSLKHLIGPFDSLLTWAEDSALRDGPLCGSIDGVLLIIVQLCSYIISVEAPAAGHQEFTNSTNTALGVGLLSAAAVSLATNITELPKFGTDAIRIAFRMGVHVLSISQSLETLDLAAEQRDSWAFVVHKIQPEEAQQELEALHAAAPAPETGKIFVSAVSRSSITVSGPPSRLKNLFQKSKMFRDAISIALPVYGGLCHAPHVYGRKDVQAVIHKEAESLHIQARSGFPLAKPLRSTSTGDFYKSTGVELFEDVVTELLTKAICWDNVVEKVAHDVAQKNASTVTVNCWGESNSIRDLDAGLKSEKSDVKIQLNNYMTSLMEQDLPSSAPRGTAQSKLAIVGMSCRLPGGATDTERFWEVLENGLDVSREIPADRFDIDTHYDAEGKDMNKSMTRYGCFLDDPASFDAPFFNMSPREAQAVDPQMRLSLVTAYEALERSGFVGNRTFSTKLERIGTYFGQAADDYREVNQGQEVGTYYIPGGCRAFGPGRINYFFKFAGPSYSIDTACSSGLAAIEVACQALWNGDVDMAVAGGVNVLTNPDGFTGLGKGHFLTKGHNACKTWDADADGYCRADGIGCVVVKRLEDALSDNDNILGTVLAAGTNHSAQAVSITHPHAGHQSFLSRQILRQAGVNPLDVSYIELHGTGTQAGDFEEMTGILDVYAPGTSPRRRPEQTLHIGGSKANIGHGESVAGTSALIKVLMMLQKNAIPRHIGIKGEINPKFPDLKARNVHIPFEQASWPMGDKQRIAVVNNFGAAGGNTMMLLEEAPKAEAPAEDPRPTQVIAVSAKTKKSLSANIEKLIDHLDANIGEVRLCDLSYTTTARKYQHSYRIAFPASGIPQVRSQLVSHADKVDSLRPVNKSAGSAPSVAFSFTGQGASYKSVSLELYRDASAFRDQIQHLDGLAQAQGFPSFVPALDGSYPRDHQHSAVITQLAQVCTQIALADYWSTSLGVSPDLVVGHSLGEYAALQVAGVISANDAIFMVGCRAEMLEARCQTGSHCMVAVRASLADIRASIKGKKHTVACINSPTDTVLAGTQQEMDELTTILEADGMRCIKLGVAFAFHSEQTDPILEDFESACKSVTFQEPKLPVISPLLAKSVCDGRTFNATYMRRATRETVDFRQALEGAQDVSIGDDTVWIEIGAHPVCVGFIKATLPSTQLALPSMRRGEDNWKTLSETMAALHLAGVEVSWNDFHAPFSQCVRLLDLPTYSWDEKKYWMQYNGDWCLTKGNTYYNDKLVTTRSAASSAPVYESVSSLVQNIIACELEDKAGTVVMQSDLMQKDFLKAAHGHRMNDCGVVTSSIHADIAYTLCGYLFSKFYPKASTPAMDIMNLAVTSALIAQKGSTTRPQLIQVTASTSDIDAGILDLTWQNVDAEGNALESFATASVILGDAAQWLSSWSPMAHLVQHRIESLEALAAQGLANRLSRSMAYWLFAKNLVDYADKYRGMQSVVLNDLEAFAEVTLSEKEDGGKFTVPPYFIDSVAHLAGFIMNCSDALDTNNNYCVTSGWESMRFAEPLVAGQRYKSYVKMIPTKKDPAVYLGDVYILRAEDNVIVGMVGGIHFRSFPRILLNRFFSATTVTDTAAAGAPPPAKPVVRVERPAKPAAIFTPPSSNGSDSGFDEPELHKKAAPPSPKVSQATPVSTKEVPVAATNTVADKALDLISRETGLEPSELTDDAEFAGLGIDSLMSLVLAEKFRLELNVKVNGSLFLDYPSIGELRNWLEEYYG